jgi:hypothetical protein
MTTGPSTAPVRRPKIRYVERFKPWDELPTPLPLFAGEVETRTALTLDASRLDLPRMAAHAYGQPAAAS